MIWNVINVYTIPWSIDWVPVTQIVYVLEWDPTNECNNIVKYSDWSDWTGWTSNIQWISV